MVHVTARMKLFKTEEGGRTSFVRSGYRPNIQFGGLYTDGVFTFLDRQQAYPGDEYEVCVTFVHPDSVKEYLRVGACFAVMEGPRKVGEGTILSLSTALDEQGEHTEKELHNVSTSLGHL
jgi:translation elongation factor EF-Tu-like GTPase